MCRALFLIATTTYKLVLPIQHKIWRYEVYKSIGRALIKTLSCNVATSFLEPATSIHPLKPVLEGHKEARLFQDKVVPYWEDLCIIIGGDMADGGGAQSHADVENNHLNREEEVQETSMHEERIGVVGTEGDEEETTQDAKKSRSNARGSRDSSGSTTSKKRKKRKKTKYDLYAEKLSEITETIKGMSATKDEDVLSDVFDDVMKMKSMDSQKRIIDYDSLSSDIRKCKAFLAMNDQVKDDWVKLKFG